VSARIVVTLILEYAGEDTAEYDRAMEVGRVYVQDAGNDVAMECETVRVVDVQVSG
jgi:hypothetical protein